jgi:phage shock protein A
MWNSRAELAVKSGQDDLAREALKKRKANQVQMSTWSAQLEQQSKAVDQLLGNTREMESKLAEAKSKKETLKARAATAKSTKQVCARRARARALRAKLAQLLSLVTSATPAPDLASTRASRCQLQCRPRAWRFDFAACSYVAHRLNALAHSVQIQELVSGLDTGSSFAAFDKMEEKVTALEAEAESTQALIGSDSLEGKFKQLESGPGVDDELSKCARRDSVLLRFILCIAAFVLHSSAALPRCCLLKVSAPGCSATLTWAVRRLHSHG